MPLLRSSRGHVLRNQGDASHRAGTYHLSDFLSAQASPLKKEALTPAKCCLPRSFVAVPLRNRGSGVARTAQHTTSLASSRQQPGTQLFAEHSFSQSNRGHSSLPCPVPDTPALSPIRRGHCKFPGYPTTTCAPSRDVQDCRAVRRQLAEAGYLVDEQSTKPGRERGDHEFEVGGIVG